MSDEIRLRRPGEPKDNELPRNVKLIMVGERPIFVRRMGGVFMPLPEEEQERLKQKHIQ